MKKKEDRMPSNVSSQKKQSKPMSSSTEITPEKKIEITDNPGKTQQKIPNMK